MFVDHMLCTIDGAQTTELGRVGSDISRAYANGHLSESDHQRLWEAIEARRAEIRPKPRRAASGSPRASARRRQRSPERQASIARRRLLAASGPMPPALAARFTTGELAALKVVAGEAARHGVCSLHIDAIAAIAGTCRTVVQNALRMARALGLVTVSERRRRGQRSLTNLVRIVSAEWQTWLRRGGGFRKLNTTNISSETQTKNRGFGGNWERHYRRYDPGDKKYGRA